MNGNKLSVITSQLHNPYEVSQ